jgi:tetratricopeptide (TPR) repeat protein
MPQPGDKSSVPTPAASSQEGAGRRWPKLSVLLTAGAGVLLALGGLIWWQVTRNAGPPPSELHAQALRWLEEGSETALSRARRAALRLRKLDYRDPEFGGGVEYILGICAFRDALAPDAADTEDQLAQATRHLLEAERLALDESRRPDWSYALGTSLHRTGRWEQARPLLEDAVEGYPPGRLDATLQLAEIAIDVEVPQDLEHSLARCRALLDEPGLNGETVDLVYLLTARLLLALERGAEVQPLLERRGSDPRVPPERMKSDAAVIVAAQVAMAAGGADGHLEALRLLDPISRRSGLEQTYSSRASYLMGAAEEALGRLEADAGRTTAAASHFDAAVTHYERTAKRYGSLDESLAAQLRAATLLRQADRNEEALTTYQQVLERVKPDVSFRNRWLTLAAFREAVQTAWTEWLDADNYPAAIAISERMSPLFDPLKARELHAIANQRWAEHLEQELQRAPRADRPARLPQVRQRWQESGRAWSELADELKTTSRYTDALWTSADHFRRGHDFRQAHTQLTRFVQAQPRKQLPLALVRLGQVLLDLDEPAEAQTQLERVTREYPRDVAAIEARYLTGEALLEQQKLDAAESAWRQLLSAADLTPAAREWKQALFSLGRLVYHRAVIARRQAESERLADDPDGRARRLDEAFRRWDEAVLRLEEFLERYPDVPEAVEARYMLAKSLAQRSERARLRLAVADTENARLELRREMYADLEQASIEFLELRTTLTTRQTVDGLDPLEERILRDCCFEGAHMLYALGQYREAITHYSSAANRYAQDPRVLLAYLQMANCNERLGRPAETRSLVEQARVLLDGMPPETFEMQLTSLDRDEWQAWIDWARDALDTDSSEPAGAAASAIP